MYPEVVGVANSSNKGSIDSQHSALKDVMRERLHYLAADNMEHANSRMPMVGCITHVAGSPLPHTKQLMS